MLFGTIFGVIIVPGLYYIFGRLAEGKSLIKYEHDKPLTEEEEKALLDHKHEVGANEENNEESNVETNEEQNNDNNNSIEPSDEKEETNE